MGKASFFLIGAAVGAAAGIVLNYVFGPPDDAVFDERYRSRWDRALEAGERAADQREAELRRQFEAAKRARPASQDSSQGDDLAQLPGADG